LAQSLAPADPPASGGVPNWLRWLIGIAIGVAFCWQSARSWPLGDLFGGQLALGTDAAGDQAVLLRLPSGAIAWSVALWAILAYSACLTLIHWLRVLRWKPLLDPYAWVPIRVLNRVGAVGFAATVLLPLRMGELTRPLMLARQGAGHAPVPVGAGLGTIAIERVLDGLLVTGLLFVVLFEVHPDTLARHPGVQHGAWAAAAVFGTALCGLVATMVARDFTLRMTRRILGMLSKNLAEKVIELVTHFVDGLAFLKSPWHVVQFVGLTVVYWGINGLGIWLLARGFGVYMDVLGGYAMMACLVVGMMIPNPPGSMGIFWSFLLLPAGLYAVDPDAPRTIAFALGLWLAQTGQATLFGMWGLWSDGRARRRLAGCETHIARPASGG